VGRDKKQMEEYIRKQKFAKQELPKSQKTLASFAC
jgi:hypothetical protein